MEDGVRDRDRRAEHPLLDHKIAIRHQDRGCDGQEQHRGVEVDRHLLDTWQTTLDGKAEGADDRHDEEEKSDVRGRRDGEEPDGRLEIPGDLPDGPGCRPDGDQPAKLALPAGPLVGCAGRDRGGEEASHGPMRVLPQDDLTAETDDCERHEQPEEREPDEKEPANRRPVPGGRPGSPQTGRDVRHHASRA